jgi:hypothetical protein
VNKDLIHDQIDRWNPIQVVIEQKINKELENVGIPKVTSIINRFLFFSPSTTPCPALTLSITSQEEEQKKIRVFES